MKYIIACFVAALLCSAEGSSNITARILGGATVTLVTTYPWMVAVHKVAPTTGFVGAGTLIHANWVLTSAFVAKSATSFKVIYSTLIYNSGSAVAASSIAHPAYTTAFYHHNIGLLKLGTAITTAKTMPLMPRKLCCEPDVQFKYVLTGWGLTSTTATVPSTNMMELYLPMLSNLPCMSSGWGSANIIPSVLCTPSTATSSAYTFDEGDPLVQLDPATSAPRYQVGIVSRYKPSNPIVYTRVCHYHDWLQSITGINFG